MVGLIIFVAVVCYAAYPDERVDGQCLADSPNCKKEIEYIWGYAQETYDRLNTLLTEVNQLKEIHKCMRSCLTPTPKE